VAHIEFAPSLPGILGPLAFRPETAKPLNELADVLLRGPSSLTRGERELIAAAVSEANGCGFCARSHAAFARRQLDNGDQVVAATLSDFATAPISPKLKALLSIAHHVQAGGNQVTTDDVAKARLHGATDVEIHDTVLIAAAFCMFNRYVDGLATSAPDEQGAYDAMADTIVQRGYAATMPIPNEG